MKICLIHLSFNGTAVHVAYCSVVRLVVNRLYDTLSRLKAKASNDRVSVRLAVDAVLDMALWMAKKASEASNATRSDYAVAAWLASTIVTAHGIGGLARLREVLGQEKPGMYHFDHVTLTIRHVGTSSELLAQPEAGDEEYGRAEDMEPDASLPSLLDEESWTGEPVLVEPPEFPRIHGYLDGQG